MSGLRHWLSSKDLNSPNPQNRRKAVDKLAAAGGEDAVNLIGTSLRDADSDVRTCAAEALARIGGPTAARYLTDQLLSERELTVRRIIAEAVAQLPWEHTAPKLLAALDDPDPLVRQAAAWAVRRIGWEFIDDDQRARVAILQEEWSEAAAFGPAAVEPLRQTLIRGTQQSKHLAVEALAAVGDENAFNALVSTMEDTALDMRTRKLAAGAIRSFCCSWMTDAHLAQAAAVLGR